MNLYERRDALIKEADDYLDGLKKAGKKNASEADLKYLDGIKAQVESLDDQIKNHEHTSGPVREMEAMFKGTTGVENMIPDFNPREHGAKLSRAIQAKSAYGFDLKHRDMLRIGTKAVTTETGDPLNTSENRDPSTVPGTAATALRSLFRNEQVNTGNVRFYRMSYDGAEIVAEGGKKPEADVISEPVDASLVKLATTFKHSDEVAEDVPFMIEAITTEAVRAILKRENKLIVDTLAQTTGTVEVTTDADNLLDALADAVAQAEADTGLIPEALVVSPQDHALLRKARNDGSGHHLIDPFGRVPASIFGMRLFPTNSLPKGTAYALTQGAGVFYARSGVRVEAGFNGDDWIHNMMTVRVEERVLPAIIRPELITSITIEDPA